jgi:hypothetical protein
VTALNRAPKGALIDEFAPSGVDQPNPRLAARQAIVVEQMLRFQCRRQVQRQIVGARAHLVQCHQLDAKARRDLLGNIGIVRDHAHAKGARTLRHLLPDTSQAGHAERLSAHFRAEKPFLLPFAGLHRGVGSRNHPRQRENERPGVLGDADAVGAWRIDDEDAALAGRRDVDVVDAGPRAGDDAEPRRGVHQCRRHFGRAANEDGVRAGASAASASGFRPERASTTQLASARSKAMAEGGRSSAMMIFNAIPSSVRCS